ncbi:MAG TPA: type II secretion system protein [Pyrinomonadaceae bacterium]|nr:type II secretion system protein [Pyrinomonadaceae bacterium]
MTNIIESRRQKAEGRTRKASPFLPTAYCLLPSDPRGFSLIELVITIAVLAILTLGTVPLVQVAVKRQKEQDLREALRTMREAIDQFHREALAGAQAQANQQQQQQQVDPNSGQVRPNTSAQNLNIFGDPRVRVFITDQTIFTAENIDRYPPDLDTLVKGVSVLPITAGSLGRRGNANVTALDAATEQSAIPKTKVYLRRIPVDPMTGQADWEFRSCYDAADSTSWGGENIFDVHSKSKGTSLNGEKYSDW